MAPTFFLPILQSTSPQTVELSNNSQWTVTAHSVYRSLKGQET